MLIFKISAFASAPCKYYIRISVGIISGGKCGTNQLMLRVILHYKNLYTYVENCYKLVMDDKNLIILPMNT